LNDLMRGIFTRVVLATGLAKVIRSLLWRDRVTVLLYHDPKPEMLDAHLEFLKRICDFVPMSMANSPGNGRPRAVVTFDDGHAALLPVFIKHGVRPTIYICSSIVAHDRMHWFLHPAAQAAGVRRLIRMRTVDRLDVLQSRRFRQDALGKDAKISGLSAKQIEAMRPYVDFQSHSRFHPALTLCDDQQCFDEMVRSKVEVEQMSGVPCDHFAYPYGIYGAREVAVPKAAVYKTARTTDVGWNAENSAPFRLRAFDLEDDSSVSWLAAQLTGITLLSRYLRFGRVKFLWVRLVDGPRVLRRG
jgi:peptidoglycan/xylan/chitin deacetylase (PgdA/CDA1 family)